MHKHSDSERVRVETKVSYIGEMTKLSNYRGFVYQYGS